MRTTHTRLPAVAFVAIGLGSVIHPDASGGWLDKTFSSDGWTTVRLSAGVPSAYRPSWLEVTPTGRSWVLTRRGISGAYRTELIVYTDRGVVDPRWNGGRPVTSIPNDFVLGLETTPDGGAMVLMFYSNSSGDGGYRVVTLNSTGRLIRSRVHVIPNGGGGIGGFVRLADGAVRTCVGSGQFKSFLAGLDASGHPDASIGPNGMREIAENSTCSAWRTSGVLARGNGTIQRLLRDGTPVSTWGTGGVVTGVMTDSFIEPVVMSDGRLVLGASGNPSTNNRLFWVTRLLADGRPDPSFGAGGTQEVRLGARDTRLVALDVDRAGRIILSTSSVLDDGSTRHEIVRLTSAGRFDATFGFGGRTRTSSVGIALGVDGSDRIVTLSRNAGSLILARRTP